MSGTCTAVSVGAAQGSPACGTRTSIAASPTSTREVSPARNSRAPVTVRRSVTWPDGGATVATSGTSRKTDRLEAIFCASVAVAPRSSPPATTSVGRSTTTSTVCGPGCSRSASGIGRVVA